MIRSSVFSDELSLDFDETVRICAELRVGYIAPREGLYGSDINHLQRDGAERMKEAMDRYGIGVWAVGSQFGKCSLTDPADWEFHQDVLERHLEFAHLWGSKVLRVFPMYIPDEFRRGAMPGREKRPPLEDYLPVIVERMQWACKRAEEEGVLLAIEPEGSTFSGTIPEIRAIIDAVGSKALGVSWDVANSWGRGTRAWPDQYPLIKGRVYDIHVKDLCFNEDRTETTANTHIDLGEMPWHDIFRQLLDDGYDGVANIETHLFFRMHPRYRWLQPATIDALRNLNRILAEVQGVI